MIINKEHEGKKYLTKGGYVAEISNVKPNDYTESRVRVFCTEKGNVTTLNQYGVSSYFEEMHFVRFLNKEQDPEYFL